MGDPTTRPIPQKDTIWENDVPIECLSVRPFITPLLEGPPIPPKLHVASNRGIDVMKGMLRVLLHMVPGIPVITY